MSKKTDKLRAEFDEKLRENQAASPEEERDIQDEYGGEVRDRLQDGENYTRTIPIIEEQAHIEKNVVETGRVHIAKHVHEEEVPLDLPTVYEEAEVERVPVNQYVDTPPPPVRYEGDKMIIPVLKEVIVVEKRILVVEEVHVTRRRTEKHDTQQVKLKREEIRIERIRPDDMDPEHSDL